MNHGFDLTLPLVCEGIIGDGCGGGRIFFIDGKTLFANDPQTGENTFLLDGIKNAISISKKACVISIESEEKIIKFDLSSLRKISL